MPHTIQPQMSAPNPADLSKIASELYQDLPSPLARFIATHRPFICPFHLLIEHVPKNSNILDIGCGNGVFLALLAHNHQLATAIGFDASPTAIDNANRMRQRLPQQQLSFLKIDVTQPWPPGEFSVVSMIDVLHHIPPTDQEQFIRRAAQKVAPGGRFIYKDIPTRPRWRAAMNRLHDLILAHQWIHYVPTEKVEAWMSQEGLTPTVRQTHNMLWYAHDLRIFIRPAR
jgi:2-polyprenyl-3-methyl-5-hydroxy-6-metoxy-1,4-benzoquinol methylase